MLQQLRNIDICPGGVNGSTDTYKGHRNTVKNHWVN